MNTLWQHQNGRALSFQPKAPSDTAAPVANSPARNTPPELELSAVAFVIDQNGVIIAAEPICAALFQWEPAELIGQLLELVLAAGADKIRQQLVPEQAPDSEPPPRLFALAQRKDGTSYPVAVTLELQLPHAGCWWAVAFHDVNTPPLTHRESAPIGLVPPTFAPPHSRAQVALPTGLESIPDIFQRAPDEPASQPAPATLPAPALPQPLMLAARTEPGPEPVAPSPCPAPAGEADTDTRFHELEQRLKQNASDLKRTRAHLQQQDEQINAANAAAQQATTALEEQTTRCAQLEEQLSYALQTGDDLNARLTAEQQSRAETEARLQELEQRLAQSVEELQRAQAQPQPASVPSPVPTEEGLALQDQVLELEGRLRTAVTALARATADLETERGERRRTEQRAATLAARMQQLHGDLKNHLETEQSDHQRLAQLEHQLREQTRENDLTVAKLQAALQLEQTDRKRLEAELLRSRLQPTDSARASRAQLNSLRRQLQPPVESLHHSACRLLQLELSEEQKQLAHTLLENALLLQTSLQESPEA